MAPSPGGDPAAPVRPGTRRRGDALVQAIFDGVLDQLQTVGYGRLSMEGVAAAAGTGKAALYRRWPSKDDLVAAALRAALPSPAEVPATGALRADLLAQLRCMRDACDSTSGAAFQAVQAEAGGGLLHAVVQEQVVDPCKEMIRRLLAAGAERGEVRPTAVTDQVASVGPAMLIHHTLTRGGTISEQDLVAIIDDVLLPLIRP